MLNTYDLGEIFPIIFIPPPLPHTVKEHVID